MSAAFIPLKKKYFEQFRDGKSTVEYRRYGPRWKEDLFPRGRKVILSCGYSGSRIYAETIKSIKINSSDVTGEDGVSVLEIWGRDVDLLAIYLII